jgi:hypothetical protein
MANPVDDLGNVQVEFVWGNIPMQPDDVRVANGGELLDPALDNHIIVATKYNGFPGYTPTEPFLDTIANVAVPNVVGETEADATTALTDAELVKGAVTTTTVGATTVNDGKVKTQTPVAGKKVNVGTSVALVLFAAPTVPDVTGDSEEDATDALEALGFTVTSSTSSDGADAENDGTVKSQSPVGGTKANTGSAVSLVVYEFAG